MFCLPPSIGNYPHPLVYLELFADPVRPQNEALMLEVKRLPLNSLGSRVITRLDSILRSCHLIPALDDDLTFAWGHGEALDSHDTFLLNDFLDLHSYDTL